MGPDDPVDLSVNCFGLESGVYDIRVKMLRKWPPAQEAPQLFQTFRYVPHEEVLKMRSDLRSNLDLERGLYMARVEVLDQNKNLLAISESPIAVLGEGLKIFNRGQDPMLKLGWILIHDGRPNEEFAKQMGQILSTAKKYPIHQMLLDLSLMSSNASDS